MRVLGISAFYHDSAAALLENGRIVFAAEEERFSRIKHDNSFPLQAVQACLDHAGIKISELDAVAYYEKPLLKFERVLDNFVQTYPGSLRPFLKSIPEWLGDKIKVEQTIRKLGFAGQVYFIPHHVSHAAAAFYPSPFKKAAILTIDGVGEYQTTGLWTGDGNSITPIKEIVFPHSLGLLYSTFTAFLGFRVNDDEYKVMGMAAYGQPKHVDKIKRVVQIKDDGSFNLDLDYFAFRQGFQMWNRNFEKLFGNQRHSNERITARHYDIAASIQAVTEEIYFKMLRHLHLVTKLNAVCVGGGVALNALANGKIYRETPFKKVYIFGPTGDSGAASGAALFTYHNLLKKPKRHSVEDLRLGTYFSDLMIKGSLLKSGLEYRKFSTDRQLISEVAGLLAKNKIVGWFQGRMEYGPRALGSRSILANPKSPRMKDRVNEVKFREEFRPFAGSVLEEKVQDYFKVPDSGRRSPFMTFCFQVKPGKKSYLAAVTHRDGTCRIQTVSKKDGLYYQLIREFGNRTGVYCLLNTSFNLKGDPIVESPNQAIRDLLKTRLDYLVIGNFLVTKPNGKK